MGVATITKASSELPRGYWRWSDEEEALLRKRRAEGARAKVIARELGRTPSSIGGRAHYLKTLDEANAAALSEQDRLEADTLRCATLEMVR